MLLNIVFFYIICFFFLIIIFGYGLLFKKIFNNYFTLKTHEIGFFGFIVIFLFSNIIHFFFPLNQIIASIFFVGGVILFVKYFNFKEEIKKINYILPIILYLLVVLTNNFHDDRYWYQLPYINYYQNYKIIFGANSLNIFFYNNSIYEIMSIFNIEPLTNSVYYVVPSTIIFFVTFFILEEIKVIKSNKLKVLLTFFFVLILIRYTRSKEYGADLFTMSFMFLTMYYFFKNFYNVKIENIFKIYSFFIFSIFSKIYAVFFILYPFFLLIKEFKKSIELINKKKIFLFFIILIFVPTLKNYIQSSCLIYPIQKLCISSNSWYNGNELIKSLETSGEAIAKGFKNYIYEKKDFQLTEESFLDKNKFSFFKYLVLDKDFERILIAIFFFTLAYFIFFREVKFGLNLKHKKILVISLLSFIFWLTYLPQSRYGGNIVVLSFISSLFIFFTKTSIFKLDKISKAFISLCIVFFVVKNLVRINDQIYYSKMNDIKFPFLEFNDFTAKEKRINQFKLLVSNNERYCVNSKTLCVTNSIFDSIESITTINGYIFIKPNKDSMYEALKIQNTDHKMTFIDYK